MLFFHGCYETYYKTLIVNTLVSMVALVAMVTVVTMVTSCMRCVYFIFLDIFSCKSFKILVDVIVVRVLDLKNCSPKCI